MKVPVSPEQMLKLVGTEYVPLRVPPVIRPVKLTLSLPCTAPNVTLEPVTSPVMLPEVRHGEPPIVTLPVIAVSDLVKVADTIPPPLSLLLDQVPLQLPSSSAGGWLLAHAASTTASNAKAPTRNIAVNDGTNRVGFIDSPPLLDFSLHRMLVSRRQSCQGAS